MMTVAVNDGLARGIGSFHKFQALYLRVSEVATMTSSMVWNNPVSSRPKPTPQDASQRGRGQAPQRPGHLMAASGVWNAVVPRVNQCQPTRHDEQQRRKKDMLRGCGGIAAVQVTGASPARGQPARGLGLTETGWNLRCLRLSVYLSVLPVSGMHPRKWAPSCIKHRRVST